MGVWIVEITADGIVTGRVGPFRTEAAADRFVDVVMAPVMPNATFSIVDLVSPSEMYLALNIRTLRIHKAPKSKSTNNKS